MINKIPLEVVDRLPSFAKKTLSFILLNLRYYKWIYTKKGDVPHLVKLSMFDSYKNKYHLQAMVETGTFLGNTIEQMKNKFKKIYSIEIDEKLYNRAKIRFKEEQNVYVYHGDSGKTLPKILKITKNMPTLFWLDAHYSGSITARGDIDTPIIKELNSIFKFNNNKNVILIDDAKDFNGKNDYPKITWFRKFIHKKLPKHKVSISNNIIIIEPNQ